LTPLPKTFRIGDLIGAFFPPLIGIEYLPAMRFLLPPGRPPPRLAVPATTAFACRTAEPSLAPRRSASLATADHLDFRFAVFAFRVCFVALLAVHGIFQKQKAPPGRVPDGALSKPATYKCSGND